MSLTGLPVISTLLFPLRGKAAVVFSLIKEDNTALLLDAAYAYNFAVGKNPDSVAPLFTLTAGAGITLLTPYASGQINLALTAPQVAMLSTLRLYSFLLTVVDASSNVILTMTGRLMPVNELPSKSTLSIASGGTTTLSTSFVNTVTLAGLVGGTGYLDGIVTATQTVGCILEYIDSNGQVRGWILETSTQATVADAYQRPLDYNGSTNTKVWRSLY